MKLSVSLSAATQLRWISRASRAVSMHLGMKVAPWPESADAGIAR